MDEEAFEKLILAYDYSTRKNSKYMVLEEEPDQIENGSYKYPALKFVKETLMIEYFEQLSQEEQEEITEVIQILYRQTFVLERKFDKRQGRMVPVREYRVLSKHLEFIRAYFKVAGITLRENAHMGVIYIQGEQLWGEKLSRLATIYLLVLKLIYDEQMETVSSSSHIVTTVGALNGKAGEFRVLRGLPSPTEMRRTIALLKKIPDHRTT